MITSLNNERIRHLTALRDKSRVRNEERLFFGEGLKMFEEAPEELLRQIYVGETLFQELEGGAYPSIWKKLQRCTEAGIFTEQVSQGVLRKAADTCAPQGILFVMEQLSYSLGDIIESAAQRYKRGGSAPLFLLLEDVQDPGNLGAMLRTGEGAGVDCVVMTRGTVDIYNPKTIRATMGSLYRVPFVYTERLSEAVSLLRAKGIRVYAAHLDGDRYYDEVSYQCGSAFLIGNEGKGLRRETAALSDAFLKIPMKGKLESLNAAIAAALLLYQAAGCERRNQKRKGE